MSKKGSKKAKVKKTELWSLKRILEFFVIAGSVAGLVLGLLYKNKKAKK